MDDPYTILGVPRDASPEDIRRAYISQAKQHHPDLNPSNLKAEERFKAVSAANDLLSDPAQRARFDQGEIDAAGHEPPPRPSYRDYAESEHGRRYGRNGPQSGHWSAEDLGDLFGADVFGTMFNQGGSSDGEVHRRGHDQHYTLTTDFLDAVNGSTRRVTLPDGRVLDVKIPPGTANGQTLRLRHQGSDGVDGGPNGDVLIEILVAPHWQFERHGQDIRLVLPVTLSEAVLGGFVAVPTPGGPVRMRIQPYSDSGTKLRLRGRGVPGLGERAAGDLYVTLRIKLGERDPALEAFLRSRQPERSEAVGPMMEAADD